MSDEALRELERAAKEDPVALTRLTAERLRRREGVLLVWIAERGDYQIHLSETVGLRTPPKTPTGPDGAIEVVLRGFASGGEAALGLPTTPAAPSEKQAWILACPDVASYVMSGVLGFAPSHVGKDVSGPMFLDLRSGRLASLVSITAGVTVEAKS